MTRLTHYSVLGAGSWGTALALVLARKGHSVCLWGRCEKTMAQMQQDRCNQQYLPNALFPPTLQATAQLTHAMQHGKQILIAIPSHAFAELLKMLKPMHQHHQYISASKGLAAHGKRFLHELILETFGEQTSFAVLSGPSFAKEVAANKPTAVVIASQNKQYLWQCVEDFSHENFRAYANEDLIGTQLGGVMKNILAIATGISDGLGMGINARSALMTRGLAEMLRLGQALGCQHETLMGLSGVGDLFLSCSDNQSRNRRFGLYLGQGHSQTAAHQEIGQVVEGVYHVEQVLAMAEQHQIDMPITQVVQAILSERLSPSQALDALMQRTLRYESNTNGNAATTS